MKYIKLYEAFIAERIKAPKALEEIIKGNTSKWEGIKMSKDLADHYMTWLRTSPWGKKQGSDLPLDMVIKASFSWGIDRGLDPKLKPELDALKSSIKESFLDEYQPEDWNEDEVTESTLDITGHAYNMWNDKKVQRELRDIDIKIVGDMKGVMTISGNDKELDKVRAIFGIKESVMEGTSDYGGRAGLTKAETLKIAQKFADAAASVDTEKGKWTVNKRTLEEDSFDLDYNGEEYDGGSYNIYKNGNVVNMALRENPVLGKVDDDIKTIAKGFKKMMSNK